MGEDSVCSTESDEAAVPKRSKMSVRRIISFAISVEAFDKAEHKFVK